ncbi:putative costars [Lyophyllum shimeji]|uniref:Costars n=1 Tax=Lyophyllum shimeji TaxID=47721 RepID=A0A9P3UJD4_LYOSH|nr:putative costars [Lyophyllum shimeji]
MNTSHEIEILKDAIKEFGTANADGTTSVSYGVLFDKTANTLEALNGTLRAAKRQKKVAFNAELLMMPKDKDVQVVKLEHSEHTAEGRVDTIIEGPNYTAILTPILFLSSRSRTAVKRGHVQSLSGRAVKWRMWHILPNPHPQSHIHDGEPLRSILIAVAMWIAFNLCTAFSLRP